MELGTCLPRDRLGHRPGEVSPRGVRSGLPALPGLGSGPGPLRVPWDTYPPGVVPRPRGQPGHPAPARDLRALIGRARPAPRRAPLRPVAPDLPSSAFFPPRTAGQGRSSDRWSSSGCPVWVLGGQDGAEGGRTGWEGERCKERKGEGNAWLALWVGSAESQRRAGRQIPPGNRSWPHVTPQLLRCWFSPLSHCGAPTSLVRAIRAQRYAGPPGFKLSFQGTSSCPLAVTQSPCRSPGKHTDSLSGHSFPDK